MQWIIVVILVTLVLGSETPRLPPVGAQLDPVGVVPEMGLARPHAVLVPSREAVRPVHRERKPVGAPPAPTASPDHRPSPAPDVSRVGPSPSPKRSVRGTASWYCLPGRSSCSGSRTGGLYAAAGSELRHGRWRGRVVVVCAGRRCLNVKLIDYCACRGSRIIDLYADAFRRLAPLDRGVLKVTVKW